MRVIKLYQKTATRVAHASILVREMRFDVAPDKISKDVAIFSLFVVAVTSNQVNYARLPALNLGYLSVAPMCGISFGCQTTHFILSKLSKLSHPMS